MIKDIENLESTIDEAKEWSASLTGNPVGFAQPTFYSTLEEKEMRP